MYTAGISKVYSYLLFTLTPKSIATFRASECSILDNVIKQIRKRLIELPQKWQDIQDLHDEFKLVVFQLKTEWFHISELEQYFVLVSLLLRIGLTGCGTKLDDI